MPDERGRGHIQGGIPGPLLRGQTASAACVCVWHDRPLGGAWVECSVACKFLQQRAGLPPDPAERLASGPAAENATACRIHFPKLGQEESSSRPRWIKRICNSAGEERCHFVGGHIQQLFSSGY